MRAAQFSFDCSVKFANGLPRAAALARVGDASEGADNLRLYPTFMAAFSCFKRTGDKAAAPAVPSMPSISAHLREMLSAKKTKERGRSGSPQNRRSTKNDARDEKCNCQTTGSLIIQIQ